MVNDLNLNIYLFRIDTISFSVDKYTFRNNPYTQPITTEVIDIEFSLYQGVRKGGYGGPQPMPPEKQCVQSFFYAVHIHIHEQKYYESGKCHLSTDAEFIAPLWPYGLLWRDPLCTVMTGHQSAALMSRQ